MAPMAQPEAPTDYGDLKVTNNMRLPTGLPSIVRLTSDAAVLIYMPYPLNEDYKTMPSDFGGTLTGKGTTPSYSPNLREDAGDGVTDLPRGQQPKGDLTLWNGNASHGITVAQEDLLNESTNVAMTSGKRMRARMATQAEITTNKQPGGWFVDYVA